MPFRPLLPVFRGHSRRTRSRRRVATPVVVCPPPQTLLSDIVAVSASCGMYGSYSGQVELENANEQYTPSLMWDVFQFTLSNGVFTSGVSFDKTGLSANVQWLYGLVGGYEERHETSRRSVVLDIISFFHRLSGKPINTELYVSDTATVLSEIAETYASLPSAFFDFSGISGKPFRGNVTGNNMLEEMQRIAQVARANLFVQKTGVLTGGAWKDSTSPVDYVIPEQLTVSASTIIADGIGPSRIKVRGRYVSRTECGTQYLMSPIVGNPGAGYVTFCVITAVAQPSTKVRFSAISGPSWTYRNGEVEVTGASSAVVDISSEGKKTGNAYDDSQIVLDLEASDSGTYFTPTATQVGVRMTGESRAPQEYDSPTNYNRYEKSSRAHAEDAVAQFSTYLQKTSGHGTRRGGGARHQDNNYAADEADPIRLEMEVVDTDLEAEFGVVVEQLDNLYISDYATAFDVAVRRFQEFKMQRRAWRVKVAYIPTIELNDVVRFKPPRKSFTVTGVVTNIQFDYTNEPAASMELIVESLESIGGTLYTSGKMVGCAELSSMTASNSERVVLLNGTVIVSGLAGETQYAELSMETVPGYTYVVRVDVVKISGAGTFTLSLLDSGGTIQTNTPTSSSTSVFNNFIASQTVTKLRMEVASITIPLQWQVTDIDWRVQRVG